jgi:hypothetical protein
MAREGFPNPSRVSGKIAAAPCCAFQDTTGIKKRAEVQPPRAEMQRVLADFVDKLIGREDSVLRARESWMRFAKCCQASIGNRAANRRRNSEG